MNCQVIVIFLVPPLISVQNQHVAAAVNRSTSFECEVEAYPYAIHYWEREGDIIDNDDKYSITRIDISSYKFIMQLNISSVSDTDNGTYYCVSKNDEAIVAGNITLYSKYLIKIVNNIIFNNIIYYFKHYSC